MARILGEVGLVYEWDGSPSTRILVKLTPEFHAMVKDVANEHGMMASFNNDGSSFWFSKK